MTATVATTHPTYDKLMPKWARCSDAVDGQDAVREKREAYLPKLGGEEEADYAARLKRSDFFNATWRTIAGLTGMAFRKPPVCEVPAAIEPMLADVNLAGKALDTRARGLVEDMLEYGAFGLLVDYPPMPDNVTAISAQASEAMGQRPLIQHYEIESVYNWRYARVGNRWVLVQVRLKEEADVSTDEFDHKTEDRWRVLDLDPQGFYRQRVYRKSDKSKTEYEQVGGDIYPVKNGKPLNSIPFKIVGELDEPPLIDLVDANIAHYQVNADYRHGLHFTALPTLFLAGLQAKEGETFHIGSGTAVVASDPNAKGEYIEFTGQGLDGIANALKSYEQRMAVLGARMIADETRQAETLGATQIKRAGENSILAQIVIEVSGALEWALSVMADWVGAGGAVKYEINRDFGITGLSAQDLTALVGAVQAGKVSDSELFDLLQRHDVVEPTKTFEEHQAEIEMQGPARPDVTGVAA